ncbi:hypothetical protein [Nonomuraea sp. NPDC046570]|uniref:hypothetical protein n=1 Tax=Nonomuraea sp. NPDC046570 TaxID=3155255 RepID=UPI00340DAEE9
MRTPARLTPADSLSVALTELATFNGYIQQAESKVTTMVTVHLGATALAAAQAGELTPLWAAGLPAAGAVAALLAAFVAGFLTAGHHLLRALRPDLRAPERGGHFGLVRPTGTARHPANVAEQLEEIHLLVEVLREVALHKHRRVRRAMPWMGLMLASLVGWIALGAIL